MNLDIPDKPRHLIHYVYHVYVRVLDFMLGPKRLRGRRFVRWESSSCEWFYCRAKDFVFHPETMRRSFSILVSWNRG